MSWHGPVSAAILLPSLDLSRLATLMDSLESQLQIDTRVPLSNVEKVGGIPQQIAESLFLVIRRVTRVLDQLSARHGCFRHGLFL